jgi:hypothetical protein
MLGTNGHKSAFVGLSIEQFVIHASRHAGIRLLSCHRLDHIECLHFSWRFMICHTGHALVLPLLVSIKMTPTVISITLLEELVLVIALRDGGAHGPFVQFFDLARFDLVVINHFA